MTKHEIATTDDLDPGERIIIDVGDREIGLFNIDGEYHALPNMCPHQLGPLCESKAKGTTIADEESDFKPRFDFDGKIVACPWHELEFHIPTGKCLASDEWSVNSYEVSVENGKIYIDL